MASIKASTEFGIYPVKVGAGQVALCPVPGRFGSYEADLSAILNWAPDIVLTMTGQAELDRVGAADFGADLGHAGIAWHHLPIVDFSTPDANVETAWPDVAAHCAAVLARGGRILSHCFGGCGRSGMMALRLMVDEGEDPHTALVRLRKTRPCAVEEDAQFSWAARAV